MIRSLRLSAAIITTVIYAIGLGISIMVLTWIDKLEKTACKCSEDFKRDYIKYYFYGYIVCLTLIYANALSIILSEFSVSNSAVITLIGIIRYILPIFGLINMILSIMYIWKLKQIDCKCSEDIRREIYYVLNWINVGFLGLGVLLIILSAIVWTAAIAMTFGKEVNSMMKNSSSGKSSLSKSRSK